MIEYGLLIAVMGIGVVYLFLVFMILLLKILGVVAKPDQHDAEHHGTHHADRVSGNQAQIAIAAWAYHHREEPK